MTKSYFDHISPLQTEKTKLLVSTLCFKVLGIRWYNWNPSISVHFHKNPYWLIWTTLNSYLDDNFNSATFWCLYTLWCQFFWNWQCVKRDHDKTIRQLIDWLIIYGFIARIIHLYGDVTITDEGLQNLGLCSALRVFEQFYDSATSVVTWSLNFSGLIQHSAPPKTNKHKKTSHSTPNKQIPNQTTIFFKYPYRNSSLWQHGRPAKAKIGSDVMEE